MCSNKVPIFPTPTTPPQWKITTNLAYAIINLPTSQQDSGEQNNFPLPPVPSPEPDFPPPTTPSQWKIPTNLAHAIINLPTSQQDSGEQNNWPLSPVPSPEPDSYLTLIPTVTSEKTFPLPGITITASPLLCQTHDLALTISHCIPISACPPLASPQIHGRATNNSSTSDTTMAKTYNADYDYENADEYPHTPKPSLHTPRSHLPSGKDNLVYDYPYAWIPGKAHPNNKYIHSCSGGSRMFPLLQHDSLIPAGKFHAATSVDSCMSTCMTKGNDDAAPWNHSLKVMPAYRILVPPPSSLKAMPLHPKMTFSSLQTDPNATAPPTTDKWRSVNCASDHGVVTKPRDAVKMTMVKDKNMKVVLEPVVSKEPSLWVTAPAVVPSFIIHMTENNVVDSHVENPLLADIREKLEKEAENANIDPPFTAPQPPITTPKPDHLLTLMSPTISSKVPMQMSEDTWENIPRRAKPGRSRVSVIHSEVSENSYT